MIDASDPRLRKLIQAHMGAVPQRQGNPDPRAVMGAPPVQQSPAVTPPINPASPSAQMMQMAMQRMGRGNGY